MRQMRISMVLIGVIIISMACSAPTSEMPPVTATTPPASVTQQSQSKPLISGTGIETIELLTDTQGVGTKPLFEWKAVSGAARYELIVYDAAGAPYWAWDGTQTKVYLGGGNTQPPADSAGPSVTAGYSWSVVAFNDNDKVVAASDARPVSP